MVSKRSRLPASRPGTQGRAGRQNTRNYKGLNCSRPQAFPDRGGNAQAQQRRHFPGSRGFLREGEHRECSPPRLQWLAGHGNDAPIRRHGSFLAEKPCGGRRARRFATVRVQTGVCRVCGLQPASSKRPPAEIQCWSESRAICSHRHPNLLAHAPANGDQRKSDGDTDLRNLSQLNAGESVNERRELPIGRVRQ